MKRRTLLIAGAMSAVLLTQWVHAAGYPTKPIRLVVPFAPGGSADFVARVISEAMMRELGQPLVVDNRAGAGGVIGTMEVVRAAPDGYTLTMATPSTTAANPAINPNAGYDPVNDLTPIVNVAAGPVILAVRPGFPAKTYQDLVAELKKNPDRYSYASPGVGGVLHLQMELFKSLTGTSITHVPFKGAGPALTAVVGDQVDMLQDALPSALPFVKGGKLIPILVSAPARIKEMPNVPTFAEVGLTPLNFMSHWGILGPKNLPQEVVDRINGAVRQAVQDPKVKQRIEDSGAFVMANSPQDFGKEISQIYTQLKKVVAERKLTMD